MNDKKNPLVILEALGWTFEPMGAQMVCDCPFCGGSKKLYADPKTTKWDCKTCMESGNEVTAMLKMHNKVYRKALTEKRTKALAEYRKLPVEAFTCVPELGFDELHDRYTWIQLKPNGMPTSIRTCVIPKPGAKKTKRNVVHALKGTNLGLLGAEELANEGRKTEPVYIAEGEWDFHALTWALMEAGRVGVVVAVPGAGVFSKDWVGWFAHREVIGCYDHDDAGRKGSVYCYEKIRSVAKNLRFLHWEEGTQDGADVHDLVRDNIKKPERALEYIQSHLKTTPTGHSEDPNSLVKNDDRRAEQEELEPITVDELHEVFDKWLLLSNYDLLDVTMAVLWTLYLPGNPLWMFVIAPPSGSKSETIMPASQWWRCHALSNMTSKSLVSGFKGAGDSDPSLFASLDGTRSAIAVKDLTPLLQGRPEERDEVFGILRDAYDGSVTKAFGNGIIREYKKLHFTMLAGVTPAIDTASHTALGERFLKFRADRDLDRTDDIARAVRAIENCGNEEAMRNELREACVRSLVRPFDEGAVPKPSGDFTQLIARLAFLVAHLRAVSPTERGTNLQTMSPMVEAPPRLATQFVKFAQGLALHLEVSSLDEPRVQRLTRRVALHTVDMISAQVAHVMFAMHCNAGIDMTGIQVLLPRLSRDTIRDVLARFHRVGIIEIKKDGNAHMFKFRDAIFQLLRDTRFFLDLPKTDVHYRPELVPGEEQSGKRRIMVRRK